jgi:nucleotide-binding universal stress UspA family protein
MSGKPRHWLALVDGSDLAQHAFDLTLKLMCKGQKSEVAFVDKLTILHVYDQSKYAYLPAQLRHDAIRSKFEDILIGTIPRDHFEVVIREVGAGQKAKFAIQDLAKELQCDVLVLGVFGRKRMSQDQENNEHCGSTVEHLLRSPSAPVVIVRPGAYEPENNTVPLSLLIGVDGTHAGFHALRVATTFMREGHNDKITIVHSYNELDGVHNLASRQAIKAEALSILSAAHCNGEYKEVCFVFHPQHHFLIL